MTSSSHSRRNSEEKLLLHKHSESEEPLLHLLDVYEAEDRVKNPSKSTDESNHETIDPSLTDDEQTLLQVSHDSDELSEIKSDKLNSPLAKMKNRDPQYERQITFIEHATLEAPHIIKNGWGRVDKMLLDIKQYTQLPYGMKWTDINDIVARILLYAIFEYSDRSIKTAILILKNYDIDLNKENYFDLRRKDGDWRNGPVLPLSMAILEGANAPYEFFKVRDNINQKLIIILLKKGANIYQLFDDDYNRLSPINILMAGLVNTDFYHESTIINIVSLVLQYQKRNNTYQSNICMLVLRHILDFIFIKDYHASLDEKYKYLNKENIKTAVSLILFLLDNNMVNVNDRISVNINYGYHHEQFFSEFTLMHYVIFKFYKKPKKYVHDIVKKLLSLGHNPNIRSRVSLEYNFLSHGRYPLLTPIEYAAYLGYWEIVITLIKFQKLAITHEEEFINRVMFIAIANTLKSDNVVQADDSETFNTAACTLLENGADPNYSSLMSLEHKIDKIYSDVNVYPLWIATNCRNPNESLIYTLIKKGARLDIIVDGAYCNKSVAESLNRRVSSKFPFLVLLALCKRWRSIIILLEATNQHPNLTKDYLGLVLYTILDADKLTPESIFVSHFLLKLGANPNLHIDDDSPNVRSCLFTAWVNNYKTLVKDLIIHGAILKKQEQTHSYQNETIRQFLIPEVTNEMNARVLFAIWARLTHPNQIKAQYPTQASQDPFYIILKAPKDIAVYIFSFLLIGELFAPIKRPESLRRITPTIEDSKREDKSTVLSNNTNDKAESNSLFYSLFDTEQEVKSISISTSTSLSLSSGVTMVDTSTALPNTSIIPEESAQVYPSKKLISTPILKKMAQIQKIVNIKIASNQSIQRNINESVQPNCFDSTPFPSSLAALPSSVRPVEIKLNPQGAGDTHLIQHNINEAKSPVIKTSELLSVEVRQNILKLLGDYQRKWFKSTDRDENVRELLANINSKNDLNLTELQQWVKSASVKAKLADLSANQSRFFSRNITGSRYQNTLASINVLINRP